MVKETVVSDASDCKDCLYSGILYCFHPKNGRGAINYSTAIASMITRGTSPKWCPLRIENLPPKD